MLNDVNCNYTFPKWRGINRTEKLRSSPGPVQGLLKSEKSLQKVCTALMHYIYFSVIIRLHYCDFQFNFHRTMTEKF